MGIGIDYRIVWAAIGLIFYLGFIVLLCRVMMFLKNPDDPEQ